MSQQSNRKQINSGGEEDEGGIKRQTGEKRVMKGSEIERERQTYGGGEESEGTGEIGE